MSAWATSCPTRPTSPPAAASIRAARSPNRAAPSKRPSPSRAPAAAWSACWRLRSCGPRARRPAVLPDLLPLRQVEARQLIAEGLEVEGLHEAVGADVGVQRHPVGLLGDDLDRGRVGNLALGWIGRGAAFLDQLLQLGGRAR